MRKLHRGILIAIEGIDGSGKTTLARDLTHSLSTEFPVVLTKEPGGSAVGKVLREILQTQKMPLTPKAEYLLFAADRAQHFHEVIIPALQENKIIISDRMADSSVVYQGYGRGLDIDNIKTVNRWAMDSIKPDLVFYLRISPETARERLYKRNEELTAFEKEQATFTQKLVDGFETIFKDRTNVIILDGAQSPQELNDHATKVVHAWIKEQNLLT